MHDAETTKTTGLPPLKRSIVGYINYTSLRHSAWPRRLLTPCLSLLMAALLPALLPLYKNLSLSFPLFNHPPSPRSSGFGPPHLGCPLSVSLICITGLLCHLSWSLLQLVLRQGCCCSGALSTESNPREALCLGSGSPLWPPPLTSTCSPIPGHAKFMVF